MKSTVQHRGPVLSRRISRREFRGIVRAERAIVGSLNELGNRPELAVAHETFRRMAEFVVYAASRAQHGRLLHVYTHVCRMPQEVTNRGRQFVIGGRLAQRLTRAAASAGVTPEQVCDQALRELVAQLENGEEP